MAAFSFQENGLTHSRTLMPMVRDMLKNADIPLKSVDLMAASIGPGSFTGIRIGVSAVKGLAWTDDIPCVGVSPLEAMAECVAFMGGHVCCVMDARVNQVYNAIFDCTGGAPVRLCEDRALSIDRLEGELKASGKRHLLTGDGAVLCYGSMDKSVVSLAPAQLRMQSAWGVALAAAHGHLPGVPCADLNPVYLRPSQAEREKLARGALNTVNNL